MIGLFLLTLLGAQPPADPALQPLAFLEGTWDAKTQTGPANAAAAGTYSFVKELSGHILARHSSAGDHNDLLYVYADAPGQPLKAIYFDSEGHVIHYSVSATPSSVVFLSDASTPGPQYRLFYEREADMLSGKFQMRMPGNAEWTSYLEWSGSKK